MEIEIDKPEQYQTRDGDEVLAFYTEGIEDIFVVTKGEGYVGYDVGLDGKYPCAKHRALDIIPKEKRLYQQVRLEDGEHPRINFSSKPHGPCLTWIEGKPETVELIK